MLPGLTRSQTVTLFSAGVEGQLMGCTALVLLVFLIQSVPQLRVSSASSCSGGDGNPPSFISNGQPPEMVLVNLEESGKNLVVPCAVSGTHPITVSWFREGTSTPIRQVSLESGEANCTLSTNVTEAEAPRDGINYYCVATNRIGSIYSLRSRNVNVSSSFFGGFQNRESEVATLEGGDVALECAFNPSNPAPNNITWFANGTVVVAETSRIQFLEGGRYLYIEDLTADDRVKRYHCEVNQNGMTIRAPTTYTLSTLIPEGITVYFNRTTVSGTVNQPVELVFAAAARDSIGSLTVTINCPRGNSLVTFAPSDVTSVPATLTEAARNEAQVEFTCEIAATQGSVMSEDVMVTIKLPKSSPTITSALPNDDREQVVEGRPQEYSCVASGFPPPTITWYYNGAVVQSGSGGVVVGGDGTSLTISAPQFNNSGIYQCFARNQFGQDSRTWILENPGVSVITSITGAEEPVDAGTDLELHCMFIVVLPTNVSWSKGSTNVSNNDHFDISPVMNGMSTLRISSMAVKDGDVYSCTTTTECGSDSRDVTIEVQNTGVDNGSDDSSDDGGGSIGGLVSGIAAAVFSVLVVVAVQLFW